MRIIFIYVLIATLTLLTLSDLTAQSPNSREIKFLSWNIYMLPRFPMFTGQKNRANGIVEVLKEGEYDIICFQEAFHKGFRKIILQGLKDVYPYEIASKGTRNSIKAGSGLWVISKKPIQQIKEIEFEAKQGMEKLVRKGALLFEMDGLKDCSFIVTHLQSEDGIEETVVRKSQCTQIYNELVEPYANHKKTILFAGDWNMEPASAFDNSSLRDLFKINYPDSIPIENTWPNETFRRNAQNYIFDLVMLYSPKNQISKFRTQVPDLKYEWKKGKYDLSDHLPVEATFFLSQ